MKYINKNQLIEKYNQLHEQEEKLKELRIVEPCNCENLEIKIRKFGGGTHYVKQCNICGKQCGGSLKKTVALELLKERKPRIFDASIEEKNSLLYEQILSLWNEKQRIIALINGTNNSESKSLEEQKKFEKANKKLALFTAEIEDEFGNEKTIQALMNQIENLEKNRHQELCSSTDRFNSENQVKSWFEENFASDFHIYPEVSGVHLSEKINVRIDYILYPKEHLINEGFKPLPFGVEAKYFKQEKGFSHKASRGLWQTISYNDCRFHLKERKGRDDFEIEYSLIFSNLSFPKELMLLKNYRNYSHEENDLIQWRGMVHLASHAKVGVLVIKGERNRPMGWHIKFAGGTYFGSKVTDGEVIYYKSNENVIRTRIGNF